MENFQCLCGPLSYDTIALDTVIYFVNQYTLMHLFNEKLMKQKNKPVKSSSKSFKIPVVNIFLL